MGVENCEAEWYAIAQTKKFLPKRIRLTIYNSLFRSHMEFGILSWGGVNASKLNKITKLHNQICGKEN